MNNFFRTIQVAAIVLGVGFTASTASARPTLIPVLGATSQPIGHYDFCRRHPSECQPRRERGIVKLTSGSWSKLVEINNLVNQTIFPRTDTEMHGIPEFWSYPTSEGDCEDYALLKQYMLEREGIPVSALLMTVVRQPNGDGHAVLTVRTDGGDFVLDNLEERILSWNETEYRFLKQQSERNPGKWVSIADDRDILVGSVR